MFYRSKLKYKALCRVKKGFAENTRVHLPISSEISGLKLIINKKKKNLNKLFVFSRHSKLTKVMTLFNYSLQKFWFGLKSRNKIVEFLDKRLSVLMYELL